MKFLILFAVGVLFGSVQCDEECFRGVFKGCAREPTEMEPITLCEEVQYQIDCLSGYASKCNMEFKEQAHDLKKAIDNVCNAEKMKNWFSQEKECYQKSLRSSDCADPIDAVMKGRYEYSEKSNPIIKANKKLCNLFQPYSICVNTAVQNNCGYKSWALFKSLYDPLYHFSNSFCKQLILPADESTSRTDTFGWVNIFLTVGAMFMTV